MSRNSKKEIEQPVSKNQQPKPVFDKSVKPAKGILKKKEKTIKEKGNI